MDFFEHFCFTNKWIMDNLPPLPLNYNYNNESFYYNNSFNSMDLDMDLDMHLDMDLVEYDSEYNSESDFEQYT